MNRSSSSSCSPRSTVDSAKVREWMSALPWSPQWDWLREDMAAAIGESAPEVPEMPNPMADLPGILGDRENLLVWQPIATAPRDGTKLDLWLAKARCRVTNCHWGRPQHAESAGWVDGEDFMSGYTTEEPTHWMPVPLPP